MEDNRWQVRFWATGILPIQLLLRANYAQVALLILLSQDDTN